MTKKRNAGEVAYNTQRRASKRARLDQSHEEIVFKPSRKEGEVFKYDPLPTSQQAFRLMRVKSVDRWGTVWCGIYHYEASNCPDYIAISYCWGKENYPCMIRLNGQAFKVGKNLWSLLQTLGPRLKNKYLWIDAICIDQSSTWERNHQVRWMGQIYSGAREVVAWLGAMDEDCRKAMDYLECVIRYKGSRTRADAVASSNLQNLENLLALRRFLEREYWHRTWIIQEIILARKVRLMCGANEVKWSHLQLLRDLWCQAEYPGVQTARILDIDDCMMFRIMNQREKLTPKKLNLLIKQYRHSKCQNPRDKIYALLSLATDCKEERILEVDYKKSREQIFCDVLLFCKFRSPVRRMVLADTLRQVLRLTMTDVQAFIRNKTTFTWNALISPDRCVSIQRKAPATSTNQLQEYEGLLLGSVSSVSTAYGRAGMQACWDSGGSRLPHMDTIFEISSAKEARFRDPPGASISGYFLLQYSNVSFACIAEGDLVYQLGKSQLALVYRPTGKDSGHLLALAWTGNIARASFTDSRTQRRTFWLSPSDVLGLRLIYRPYREAMYRVQMADRKLRGLHEKVPDTRVHHGRSAKAPDRAQGFTTGVVNCFIFEQDRPVR